MHRPEPARHESGDEDAASDTEGQGDAGHRNHNKTHKGSSDAADTHHDQVRQWGWTFGIAEIFNEIFHILLRPRNLEDITFMNDGAPGQRQFMSLSGDLPEKTCVPVGAADMAKGLPHRFLVEHTYVEDFTDNIRHASVVHFGTYEIFDFEEPVADTHHCEDIVEFHDGVGSGLHNGIPSFQFFNDDRVGKHGFDLGDGLSDDPGIIGFINA